MVDGLGMSLPLLFKITAGFLVCCVLILGGVYNIFCKKYEKILVQKKEEDIRSMQQDTDGTKDSIYNQSKNFDIMSDKLTLGSSIPYLGTQITGLSRL